MILVARPTTRQVGNGPPLKLTGRIIHSIECHPEPASHYSWTGQRWVCDSPTVQEKVRDLRMPEISIIHSKSQHYYNVFHHERDGCGSETVRLDGLKMLPAIHAYNSVLSAVCT